MEISMARKKGLAAPCGLEKWIEESPEIRRRYYTSPFVVGKGQEE